MIFTAIFDFLCYELYQADGTTVTDWPNHCNEAESPKIGQEYTIRWRMPQTGE